MEEVDVAERSGPDALGGGAPVRIEAAMEADLQRDPRLAGGVDRGNCRFQVERDRLLAEDVLAGCRSGLDHLDMERRRCRDDDAVDIGIAEQVVVVCRPRYAEPFARRTRNRFVGIDDPNELCRRDAADEVLRM
jgi:hypothetical protein